MLQTGRTEQRIGLAVRRSRAFRGEVPHEGFVLMHNSDTHWSESMWHVNTEFIRRSGTCTASCSCRSVSRNPCALLLAPGVCCTMPRRHHHHAAVLPPPTPTHVPLPRRGLRDPLLTPELPYHCAGLLSDEVGVRHASCLSLAASYSHMLTCVMRAGVRGGGFTIQCANRESPKRRSVCFMGHLMLLFGAVLHHWWHSICV